jgi:uncharacterized protein (TIGR00255 family)
MTGYGRGEESRDALQITVELRAVNHRFLDVQLKMPRPWMALEPQVLALLRERVARGRVEVFVRRDHALGSGPVPRADIDLARAIATEVHRIGEALHLPAALSIDSLLALPGVLSVAEPEVDAAAEAPALLAAVDAAAAALDSMRRSEGERLVADVEARLRRVEEIAVALEALGSELPAQFQERLEKRLETLLGDAALDPNRLAQEVAILADRADVHEELTRLRAHVAQARELLAREEPPGRPLDFLVQELHREANTLGSKAVDTSVSPHIVELKSQIEKIREQVANLE